MNTDTLSPNDAINQMVALRLQRAELDTQIETLKPAFWEACATLDISAKALKPEVVRHSVRPKATHTAFALAKEFSF